MPALTLLRTFPAVRLDLPPPWLIHTQRSCQVSYDQTLFHSPIRFVSSSWGGFRSLVCWRITGLKGSTLVVRTPSRLSLISSGNGCIISGWIWHYQCLPELLTKSVPLILLIFFLFKIPTQQGLHRYCYLCEPNIRIKCDFNLQKSWWVTAQTNPWKTKQTILIGLKSTVTERLLTRGKRLSALSIQM